MKTVDALLHQQGDGLQLEVIVVTPSHGLNTFIADPRVKVVHVEKLYSPGKMRNIGAKKASGSVLGFVDDDCVPPVNWLMHMYKTLIAETNIGAVGCRVIYSGEKAVGRLADFVLFSAYQYSRPLFVPLGSAAILVRSDAFWQVGGFDEFLLASEDWDFSLKLEDEKWKCSFTPVTEVMHAHGRETLRGILKSSYLSGKRSGLVVQARHFSKMSWLAKLSVIMKSPVLYWLLIVPYSLLVTFVQGRELLKGSTGVLLPSLVMFCGKIFYHSGVWVRQLRP